MKEKKYILVTAHHEENVDDPKRFKGIMEGVKIVSEELDMPVVYPIHPGSRKMMDSGGLQEETCILGVP